MTSERGAGEGLSLAERVAGLSPEKRRVLDRLLAQQRLAELQSSSPPDSEAPLSFGQQRLWFLDCLEPGSSAFNISSALRLEGELDVEALRRSFENVVRRHQVLRTAFVEVDGIPRARVSPEKRIELPVTKLAATTDSERDLQIEKLAREQAERPFDLSEGNLIRMSLLEAGPTDHVLLVTVHHIAFDAWSVAILFDELFSGYEAYAKGESPDLPELSLQYADFSRWQRERLSDEMLKGEWDYWREKLGDLPGHLPIATDRPRPLKPALKGGRESIAIGRKTADSLKELGRREGATFFMTLLAVFELLLHRRGGEEDVVVGTPVAGRGRAETSQLIGFFVNNLVLRTDVSGEPTFKELLDRVRDVAREAYAHEDVPFEKLVELLHPERTLNRNPLFSIVFTLQPTPSPNTRGLRVRPLRIGTEAARYDLEFYVQEGASGLQAWCIYDRELFDAETVASLLESYRALAEAVVESPERPISELSPMSSSERERVLAWSENQREYPRDATLAELFALSAERYADRIALELGDEKLSYRELDERSNRLAHYLVRQGVGPEVAVGLAFDRSIAMVVSMLAVVKAGGGYVPLDASYPQERLRFMSEDARLALVLTEERLLSRLPQDVSPIRSLDRERGEIEAQPIHPVPSSASPENLAYVMYTSGSTGRPKGVEVRQRSVVRLLFGTDYAELGPEETVLHLAPTSFDASTFEIWGALLHGGRLAIYPEKHLDAEELGRTLSERNVTTLWLTGALFNAIVDEIPRALSGLRQVLAGGEALSVAHVRRAQESCPDTRFVNGYGPTEGTTFTCCYLIPDLSGREWTSIPIGGPIANTRVLVLDDRLELAAPGVPGELYIGGDGLARGYRNRPELTAERFVPDPYGGAGSRLYRTGDRVRFLRDGRIEFLGRIDAQVKLRGYRVEPGEVEAALREMGDVKEAAVVVRELAPGDRSLVAYWVASGEGADARELRRRLSERLPEYMIPSSFVRLESLPLTESGKLDRLALSASAALAIESDPELAGSGPRGPIEEAIAEIFRSLLPISGEVFAHDDFFELGGHSLLATQLASRIRETFRVELPLRAVFETPTLAGLAEQIERQRRRGEDFEEGPALVHIPRTCELPLSFPQQRLWFLEQLSPGSSAYNISGALRLVGKLDESILERSLKEIVRRHGSLRSRFESREGRAVVAIEPPGPSPLRVVDLEGLGRERAEAEARALASESAVRPFDLARGGLLRATLLRLGAEDHVLLLTMHHIVSDGWSLGVLVRELGVLYRAYHAGEPSPLQDLELQVVDHAAWQRRRLTGERLERELRYWKERLSGLEVLELPTDRPRPPVQTFGGSRESALYPKELASALAELSRKESATLFMTLLAAFQALLSRLSGQEDVVVGAPIANRQRREVEGLIGFFANNLVMRADVSGDPSFRELLGRVRDSALDAYDHQDLPFEKLVEELAPERNLSQNPLFQVTFSLQTAPEEKLELPGLSLGRLPSDARRTRFDLEVNLWSRPEGLAAVVFYNTDLFEAATVQRMLSQYRRVLEAIAAEPQRRVSELPLLSPSERSRLLAEWGRGSRREQPPWPAAGIHERFEEVAAERPGALALTTPQGPGWRYDDLNRRANRWARVLRRLGASPETRVAICVERTPELVLAVLAVLKSGAAYVPLDPDYPEERLQFLVEDAGPSLILVDAAGEAKLPFAEGRRLRIDRDPEPLESASDEENPSSLSLRDHCAYVIYTSGSTGRPKGVEVTHGNVLRLLEQSERLFGFGPEDVFTLFHSFAFDFSVWEMWGALLFGGRLSIVPYWVGRSPEAFLELLRGEKVTVLNQTPSAFRQLARAEASSRGSALSLRWVIFGGEALDLESLRGWFERHGYEHPRLVNMYGITETTVHVTYRPIEARDLETPWRSVIGRALPDLSLYVLDNALEPVPPGVQGELYVGGAGLARGYRNRPELTADRFVPDPFSGNPGSRLYRSGDLARYRTDGDVEYRGRSDHQVKVRGFRIELGEIEACLGVHPSVSEVVVIARDAESGHRRLVAYVVPKNEGGANANELRAHASASLPEYMVPAAFVFLESLPTTAHGKVDRARLPEPDAGSGARGERRPAPATESERVLALIWEEVLGVEGVATEDNFFELGGDSILSIQVVSRANDRGLALTARQLFQHQTLGALAAVAGKADLGPKEPEPSGRIPLTPIQAWFFEGERDQAHHYNQSLLLELADGTSVAGVEETLAALAQHHDALRLRFVREGQKWLQEPSADGKAAIHRIDLGGLAPADRRRALERASSLAQTSLELTSGPVARWVFFDLGPKEAPRLLWVLHHLVVDGVSWRILLEDFRRGSECYLRGEEIDFGAKTASYGRWAKALSEFSGSPEILEEERSFWKRQAESAAATFLPAELQGGKDNLEGALEHVRGSLDPDKTKILLQDFPRRFRSRIQEVLLLALGEATRGFTGEHELWVEVEAHGREEILSGLDVSRTVGWFTSLYPLRLRLASSGGPVDSLRAVKEALRAVPRNGIGYGVLRFLCGRPARELGPEREPDVSFNYLGQLDSALGDSPFYRLAKESAGAVRSPVGRRRHLLDVSAVVVSGKLQMDWMYPGHLYRRETVERLARDFFRALERLIEASPAEESLARTSSDFDLVALDPARLERILGRRRGARASVEIEDLYPVTPLQQGMLFHGLYAPESTEYLVQVGWTLEGDFDVPRFELAWKDVVERHAILRTSFDWEGSDKPLAVVHREVELPFAFLDCARGDAGEVEERLESFLLEDRRAPLTHAEAPLLRVAVLRLGERTHRFIWTFHHILLDGWSLGRVLKEVFSCYEARGRGQKAALAPAASFRSYVAWLAGRDPRASENFWRAELKGFDAPTPLGLDDDFEAAGDEASLHAEASLVWSEEASDAIRRFARERRLTPSTLFQGSWAYLLSRYSGENDVVFGAAVSGRPAELAGIESMVGLFINTIPVRVKVRDDEPLTRFLGELQAKQAEAREFEHTPLVDIQGFGGVPRGTPLFESLFVFENFPVDRRVGGRGRGLRATGFRFWTHTNYPLHFRVRPGREIALDVNYDVRRFDRETAELILRQFRAVIDRAVADPTRSVGSLLPPEPVRAVERSVRPRKAFREIPPSEAETSIPARVASVAKRFPERPAVTTDAYEWSYAELEARANRVARPLAALSREPGRVALLFGHDAPMIAAMLGALKAGDAYVPLDPRYPVARLRYILEDSEARALVTDEAHRSLAQELTSGRIPVLSFEELVESDASGDGLESHPPKNALAYLLYTSGSTGEPKGTMQSHRNVLYHIRNYTNALHLVPEDRLTLLSSYGFDASVMSIWGALANGASLHPFDLRNRDVKDLAGFLSRRSITVYHSTPTVFRYFLDSLRGDESFPSVRAVVLGGEEVSKRDVERYRKSFPRSSVLVNGLGPTESTVSLQYFIDHHTEIRGRRVPVGYPVEGVEVWLLDGEGRRTLMRGEIAFRSSHLALGYWKRPEQTEKAFLPDPDGGDRRLYRTGDLGRLRADGALEFLGRKDFQIKIRGHRVEPEEIEAVVARAAGVRECVVTAKSVFDGEARLVAYVVPRASSLDVEGLRDLLRRQLPDFMVPGDFVILDALPLTSTGKIDRRALADPKPGASRTREREAPRTPLEKDLLEIWQEVLRRDDFGIGESFFDLGGHSLLAAQVAMRIREAFGVDLPLRRLFERTTIEGLALCLLELMLEQETDEKAADLLREIP